MMKLGFRMHVDGNLALEPNAASFTARVIAPFGLENSCNRVRLDQKVTA